MPEFSFCLLLFIYFKGNSHFRFLAELDEIGSIVGTSVEVMAIMLQMHVFNSMCLNYVQTHVPQHVL